jgi:general secretion pathway protein J
MMNLARTRHSATIIDLINSIRIGRQKGFTLLEILIAIIIFVVVLTTIYTSYTGTFRVVDETESQADIYGMARIAMERMLEDLESVYIPKNDDNSHSEEGTSKLFQFVGEEQEINGRRADSLTFISRAHIDLSGGEQDYGKAEIKYSVKEDDEGGRLVLYRSDRRMLEASFSFDEESEGFVLCERLLSVAFSYQGEDGEVLQGWDSESEAFKHTLPKVVSITLEFENPLNPEKPHIFTTSVALPMEPGYL